MKFRRDDIILIVGKRRSGKTYWLKHYLMRLATTRTRYVLYDTNWEYQPQRNGIQTTNLTQIINHFNAGQLEIIYKPTEKTVEKFDLFCKVCFQLNNIVVVIEEIEQYANAYNVPRYFKKIIDIGRHKGLGLICTSRRALRLPSDLPFNADHIIIFRQHRPQDLDYMAQWVGNGIYKLPKLPEFWYMYYNDREATLTECRKI